MRFVLRFFIGVNLSMALWTKNFTVEGRTIQSIADVMKFELRLFLLTLLAAIAGAD